MGNEISKALEEDVLPSVNGVVADKLLPAASKASTSEAPVATVRRTASDVAQRQQIFAFCADWDLQRLTDLLRWIARFQDRTQESIAATTPALDLRALPIQVDALERELHSKQTLLRQVEAELELLVTNSSTTSGDGSGPTYEDPEERELVQATLENRQYETNEELHELQRKLKELKVHLLATIDGIDLTRQVQWSVFIKAVSRVYFHTALQDQARSFADSHPAAAGYAMLRDTGATKQLGEFTQGDVLLPPPANHEIDGHTDDSASSSAASEENDASSQADGSEAADEGGEDEQGTAETGESAAAIAKNEDENDDDDDDEDEEEEEEEGNGDGDEEKKVKHSDSSTDAVAPETIIAAPAPLTAEALADHDQTPTSADVPVCAYKDLVKRPRVIKRPVPPLFDAATRSPVFFGYTLEKREDELQEAVKHDDALASKEAEIFDRKTQQRQTVVDAVLKTERGKLDVLTQRQAELQQKRERYWEKRQTEFDRAKQELDPNDIFFRTRDVQDKKTRETQAFEDAETARQREKVEARMQAAQLEFDQFTDEIRLVRRTDVPLGDRRLKFHESEVDRYNIELMQAKDALATAKEEYVALKSTKAISIKITSQETKQRAQLLFAEDQIKAKERELETICALYDNELFLLKRAEDVFEREQLFLPFFLCLQQRSPATGPSAQAAFDSHNAFTVLEMAIALLLGVGGTDLKAKTSFLFKMYSKPATMSRSHTRGSSANRGAASIQLLPREAFAEILRLCLALFAKLGDFRPRQELTAEYLLGLADREFLQLEVVVDPYDVASPRNGMTSIEFGGFCTRTITRSKFLSELLGVPFQFEQLSRFVVQHMSAVHQYKLGLINVNDLKFAIAKMSITARGELSRWQKEMVHERALAMGENDPLKTDYSKYLPKRRAKLLSKVVPLDHGGYRNLLQYRMEVILRATIKLQTTWRARRGRQLARLVAEKQAFYHARGVALQEARDKVEVEWHDKDAAPAHTVEKMKFEAKIRMKQVKLRTKGHAFSREQVFALLMEEAVQTAHKEVENRFREMEEELGYLAHHEALTKPHDDLVYLKDDISKALVAQVVQAKQEKDDVAAVLDTITLSEELEKKKKMQKKKQASSQESQPTGTGNQEPQNAPEIKAGDDGDAEQHFENAEDKARRLVCTQQRLEHMVFGRFPRELYSSGLTREEHLFQVIQASPDPPLGELQQRLRKVCVGMTEFKMSELLQELPSKRHLCAYATSFRRDDGRYDLDKMEMDLLDHFRMVRGAKELAQALSQIAESDLEWGLTRELLREVQAQGEGALQELVATETGLVAHANDEATAKKLVRMGYKTPGVDDGAETPEQRGLQGNPAMVLLQKEQHELVEKKKRLQDAHTRFLDAMRLWKEAELSLHETQKSQLKVQSVYPVLPAHRTKWAERLSSALRLPEETASLLQHKYTEVWNVCQDFLESSVAIARVLVSELHLPVSHKSILPVRDAAIDGRKDDVRTTSRLQYEAHGILFKICTDDHSRCEQSHENAAKVGGHEVRNSGLYHRALLGNTSSTVLIPLECVVDYQGYRVLCCSKLPIEIISWNEAGTTIQKVTKQLVYGTDNRGKTVVFQSKELDSLLADAAQQLNLSRHGVRGYHDLTSKMLHAPADLRGYLTGDKRFAVVHFARAMPPEDPEITLHLGSSTRGLSILWRQLRPEFVAAYKTPLSSDALSSMTYCTPDWQTQALDVEHATRELIDVAIPAFARKLSQKPSYFTAASFDLTQEMHRHGINMRHLGLLRAQFPGALSGTATLQYATAEIQTTEDFTREVDRGTPLYLQGKAYTVSRHTRHRYDAQCITLNEIHTGDSVQNVTVFAGRQDCLQHAAVIRERVLVEMVARAFKNILRHLLRTASSTLAHTGLTPSLHRRIVIYSLNMLTGAERGSEDLFWKVHLYEGIRVRFGRRAVTEVDQKNLRRSLLPQLHVVVRRVSEMMGLRLRPASLDRVALHADGYLFVLDDLQDDSAYRVKHNMLMLHFSMASLLLLQATVKQATSYRQLLAQDHPDGYWPLCERRGLMVATNLGDYGKPLNGKYLAGCILEAEGPILNTDLNRAIEFRKEKRSYVVFPYVSELYPRDTTAHVALEAWCKCDGHASTRRVVLTIGRFTISALKANVWAFSLNVRNIDILAFGSHVELHKWTHLVGTFDGTMLRLFVDGFLQNEVDVDSVVDIEIAKREAVIAKTRHDISDLEEEARGTCWKQVDHEMQQWFLTKDGKKQIRTVSQKLLDEHEFRVRLSKAASSAAASPSNGEKQGGTQATASAATAATVAPSAAAGASSKRDLSRVTRTDFEPLAKKQLLREKFEVAVQLVVSEFNEMRHRVNRKIANELAEQSDHHARELRIGCLSSASRRDGKHFFHGCIAHVAYYNTKILTRDQVNAHYVMGIRDRAHTSDDLFALASTRFANALTHAPDHHATLAKFAENLCASLKYDLDHQHAQQLYKRKVLCGVALLGDTENAHGIAEVLKNLPRDPAFSDLFVTCYHKLLRIQPHYFQATASSDCQLALRQLGRMPFDFFLGSRAANSLANVEREQEEIPVFADVVQKVLVHFPSFYGDQLTDMGWLRDVRNPRVVVYFVLRMETKDNDVRWIDLQDVPDIGNDDMDVVTKHNRFATGFVLANCSLLNDFAIMRLARCCAEIEFLDLSFCSLLTDAAMVTGISKHCTRLKTLRLEHCHLISDLGVEAVVRNSPRLEQLRLSYCERVSERCMATIGASCVNLAVLELELCVQLGSAALCILATSLANPTKLRTLNLAGCHRITDDGLLEMARKCTRLQHVDVRLCDKLTDASLRVLTHNSLELETLHMEEVVHASHKLFEFDQVGDGRNVVEKNLVKKLRTLNVAACTGMDDEALANIGHRAKGLETITLAACTEMSDQGLVWLLLEDRLDKTRCGEQLTHLDVSYCPQLSAHGLHRVVMHCTKLTSLNLSGCIHLSDSNLIEIISACSQLVALELAFCRELTDAVLLAIARQLSLERLNVGRCVKITDDGMREIAGQLPVLKKLGVAACKRLTNKTLSGLLEACPLLEELDVTHCPHFSSELLAVFGRRKVKVECGKMDEISVARGVNDTGQLQNEPTNGDAQEVDGTKGDEDDEEDGARVASVVADAKRSTRKTRLPGSEPSTSNSKSKSHSNSNSNSNLPPIYQKKQR